MIGVVSELRDQEPVSVLHGRLGPGTAEGARARIEQDLDRHHVVCALTGYSVSGV
jgi:hypothetical protein